MQGSNRRNDLYELNNMGQVCRLGSAYEGQQAGNIWMGQEPTVPELRRREASILLELAEVRRLINDRDPPDIADFERSG